MKERSDAQDIVNRGCRRLNDIGENGKTKRHYGAKHIVSFLMVGDNRIELVPQRTCLEGAKRRARHSESRMQEVK